MRIIAAVFGPWKNCAFDFAWSKISISESFFASRSISLVGKDDVVSPNSLLGVEKSKSLHRAWSLRFTSTD